MKKMKRPFLNAKKRVLRGVDTEALSSAITGAKLRGSEGHGKKMLFRFGGVVWLGIHLGMTGKLSVESAEFAQGKHDHLVLFQKDRALVFNDPRQFGRIQFHQGKEAPKWWSDFESSRLPVEPGKGDATRPLKRDTEGEAMPSHFRNVGNRSKSCHLP